MTDEELRAALGEIADEPVLVPPPSTELRKRHIDAMVRGAGTATRGRRPMRGVLMGALVAALVATPALAFWHASRPAVVGTLQATGSALVVQQRSAALVDGTKTLDLRAGERIVTLAGGTAIASIDGAIATLSPRGELGVASLPGASCELRAGRARFVVAKRGSRPPFVVRAADLDVIVHGTTFEVWLDGEGRPHVWVEEGTVGLSRSGAAEIALHAREAFPDDGNTASNEPTRVLPAATQSAAPEPLPPASRTDHSPPISAGSHAVLRPVGPAAAHEEPRAIALPTASASSSVASPAQPSSQLREQNDLLWEAAEARRHGDWERERRALDSFDRKFPDAPGSHDARAAALRRAVASNDRAAARQAARAYLAAHPNGPLRDEALAAQAAE